MATKTQHFCDVCRQKVSDDEENIRAIRMSGGSKGYNGGSTHPTLSDGAVTVRLRFHARAYGQIGETKFVGRENTIDGIEVPSLGEALLFCGIPCMRAWFSRKIDRVERLWQQTATSAINERDRAMLLHAELYPVPPQPEANAGPSDLVDAGDAAEKLRESLTKNGIDGIS